MLSIQFLSTSGQSALGTLEPILSFLVSGREEDIETGRFEMLVDDYERAAHPAVIADDSNIFPLVRSLLLAPRE